MPCVFKMGRKPFSSIICKLTWTESKTCLRSFHGSLEAVTEAAFKNPFPLPFNHFFLKEGWESYVYFF